MVKKKVEFNSMKILKSLVILVMIILMMIITNGEMVYGAVSLTKIDLSSTLLLDISNQPQVEKKGSNVTFTTSSSDVKNKILSKAEAGYAQSTMGNQVAKRHEIQTDGLDVVFGNSGVYDSNVSYQKAIVLPTGSSNGIKNYTATLTYDDIGILSNRTIGVEVTFSDIKVQQSSSSNTAYTNDGLIAAKVAELNPDNIVYLHVDYPDSAQQAFRTWYKNVYAGSNDADADGRYMAGAKMLMTTPTDNYVTVCPETGWGSITYVLDRPVGTTPYIVYTNCFYSGFYYRNISSASVQIKIFYTDTGETVNLNGTYFTANSLNEGEGIYSNDISAAYARDDTVVISGTTTTSSGTVAGFLGGSDAITSNFTDKIGAEDGTFTKASVTLVSSSSVPTFVIGTTGANIYWWTLVLGPFTASAGSSQKVVLNSSNDEQTSINNVKIGDTLTYKIKQKVSALGVTSSEGYNSFSFVD